MPETEYHQDEYTLSTSKEQLNLPFIHDFLSHSSYWAQDRAQAVVEKSIEHSLYFGLYTRCQQVGFARVVTDYAPLAFT